MRTIVLILALLMQTSIWAASGPEIFHFAVVSDLHIGDTTHYTSGEPAGNFQRIASYNPAFAILPGDLTRWAASNQFVSLSNLVATNWSFPVYYLSGNHDAHEEDLDTNVMWQWWDTLMLPTAQNTNGTNRNWSFVYGPIQFIGFETCDKTNAPDVGSGVVTSNTAVYAFLAMSNAVVAEKVPLLVTHYQLATNWTWGNGWWPISGAPPSDRFTLTNGVSLFHPPFTLSGHAHATNDVGWCNGNTNILMPSLRAIDVAGTVTNGILTNGGFEIIRVYTNALVSELYIADHPAYTPLMTNEWPAYFPWGRSWVGRVTGSLNAGNVSIIH